MRNIKLLLAYDGTNYHGFQRQPEFHGPTVQGTLEKVWETLFDEEIQIYTAGRTDAGVHAAGQVVNFFSDARIPPDKIPKAVNSLLPRDLRILLAEDEKEDFNARRSAKWKRYDYLIDNRYTPDVFQRLYAYHEPVPLKLELMQEAASYMQGYHNFKAFAAAGGASKTFERTLFRCRVVKENGLIRITCIGDGFLYNMVRIIAGTLLWVGKNKINPLDIPEIIKEQKRKRAGQTAAPMGLMLMHVNYDERGPREVFPELFEI